jgi:hypothetical protein
MPMQKYEPDDRGREIVLRLGAIHNVDHEAIAFCIVNPRTNRPISVKTMLKHYSRELKLAKAEMQKLVMDSFVEALKAGNAQALKIGLNSYCGLRDSGDQITVTQNNHSNNIEWRIVAVDSPYVNEPVPGSNDIDLVANKPAQQQLPPPDGEIPVVYEPAGPPLPQGGPRHIGKYRTELDVPGATTPWYRKPLNGR